MTDVTSGPEPGQEPVLSAADEQLLRELTDRARTGGVKLTGEGGLLSRLTKMVLEGALEGEMDDHLGYARHDPEGRNGGNSRNGHRAKTVLTDTGPVDCGPVPGECLSLIVPLGHFSVSVVLLVVMSTPAAITVSLVAVAEVDSNWKCSMPEALLLLGAAAAARVPDRAIAPAASMEPAAVSRRRWFAHGDAPP